MTGCSSPEADDEVASINDTLGSTGSGAGDAAQIAIAEDYYSCLTRAGLPAVLKDMPGGEVWVGWADDLEVHIQFADDSSEHYYPTNRGPDSSFDGEAFWREGRGRDRLLIDGVEHSEEFSKCLAQSGYKKPPQPEEDPADAARLLGEALEATNDWIACVREEGLVNIDDASSPDDLPVELPLSLSEDGLRDLIEVCPVLDQERVSQIWDEMSAEGDSAEGRDVVTGPSVQIEYPDSAEVADPSEDAIAALEHYQRLSDILTEARFVANELD
jgi:hypothetical protein